MPARARKRFRQAFHCQRTVGSRHGRKNLCFNPQQLGQVECRSRTCRVRDNTIDSEEGLLELPGLAQAVRERAPENRGMHIVLFSVQDIQRAPQQIDAGFRLTAGDGKLNATPAARYGSSEYRPA